jgi:hypothetical protein
MSAFKASVVSPLRMDLLIPNYSHKLIVSGMIPEVFFWIHSNFSTNASSKEIALAGVPSLSRNIKPVVRPTLAF